VSSALFHDRGKRGTRERKLRARNRNRKEKETEREVEGEGEGTRDVAGGEREREREREERESHRQHRQRHRRCSGLPIATSSARKDIVRSVRIRMSIASTLASSLIKDTERASPESRTGTRDGGCALQGAQPPIISNWTLLSII